MSINMENGVKFFIFKVFVIIAFLNNSDGRSPHSKHTTLNSSDEITDLRNQSVVPISEINSTTGYIDSSINSVRRVINTLPSPTQILHYGKQALIGVPEEIASSAKRFLCKSQCIDYRLSYRIVPLKMF